MGLFRKKNYGEQGYLKGQLRVVRDGIAGAIPRDGNGRGWEGNINSVTQVISLCQLRSNAAQKGVAGAGGINDRIGGLLGGNMNGFVITGTRGIVKVDTALGAKSDDDMAWEA